MDAGSLSTVTERVHRAETTEIQIDNIRQRTESMNDLTRHDLLADPEESGTNNSSNPTLTVCCKRA
jgi:hypothetical protein